MERHVPCWGGGNSLKPSHNHGLWQVGMFKNLALWGESGCLNEVNYNHERGLKHGLINNELSPEFLSDKVYSLFSTHHSLIHNDMVFLRFTSHFSLKRAGATHVALCDRVGSYYRHWCGAFTLAEVLITLGIIGVVAAMTLPTLINNAQNKQLEVAFKKSYSALSQIAQRVALEDYGGQIPDDALGESLGYYAKYLNGKRCTGTAENGCPANADGDNYCNFMYKTYKDFSGKVSAPCIGNDYVVNVVSGSTFYFDYAGEGEDIYAKQFVVIDVNGWQKRPNRSGYDLFLFSIGRDGKITAGGADTSFYPKSGYCNSSTTFSRNGYGCTINAINEKDYFKKLPH